MNDLYVFAIGGSGERVFKSLVMMLAAGMPIGAKRIIPVFVDNDAKSDALTSCEKLIEYYCSDPQNNSADQFVGLHPLCKEVGSNIPTFAHVQIEKPVKLNVAGDQIGTLDKIIGQLNAQKSQEEEWIEEEKNLLFTKDDLEMPLTVGFVGNPNIGAVVLNSLSLQGEAFQNIFGKITQNDGAFVIGSLFGGTGAAGIPLIVNKLKTKSVGQQPLIGGCTCLPYFNVNAATGSTPSQIDTSRYDVNSDTFYLKTRAALMYYDVFMRDNINHLYYVGDDKNRSNYQKCVGGEKQRNPYNLIEVMAALTVVDFSKQDVANRPAQVVYHRPLWDFNAENNSVSNISCIRNQELKKALAKFQMMKVMFENDDFLNWSLAQSHDFVLSTKFDNKILNAIRDEHNLPQYPKAWALNKFFKEWDLWFKELGASNLKRQLRIFDYNGVTKENVSQKFYANSANGIAKTEEKREGLFKKRTVTRVLSPRIEDEMHEAFKELKIETAKLTSEQSLPTILKIISKALDNVIDSNCAI